ERAESRWQRTVMRQRLLFAPAAVIAIVVLQQAQLHHDGLHHGRLDLFPAAATQLTRQHDLAKARTNESAYSYAGRIEHPPDFPMPALVQGTAIPAVATPATGILQRAEPGHAIFELDTLRQAPLLVGVQLAQYTHGVLALGTVTRMHQTVGDFARGRQDEQAFRVEIEATHGQPLADLQLGKTGEDVSTPFRIIMTDDFPGGLVIQDQTRRLLLVRPCNKTPVYAHLV